MSTPGRNRKSLPQNSKTPNISQYIRDSFDKKRKTISSSPTEEAKLHEPQRKKGNIAEKKEENITEKIQEDDTGEKEENKT